MTRHSDIAEIDEVWAEFHRVVNMSSHELSDWLRTELTDEQTEPLPDDAGLELSQRVLGILGKRKADLTEEDLQAMRRVVRIVHAERRDDLETTPGQQRWRHRLMSVGHDPLKPRPGRPRSS